MVPAWKQVMDEEMEPLGSRGTWELVSASTDAVIVDCCWVFTLKYHTDLWIDIRPDSWPKGIRRHMTSTILRRSRQLQG